MPEMITFFHFTRVVPKDSLLSVRPWGEAETKRRITLERRLTLSYKLSVLVT